ncbi:hypothetical protein AB7008_37125 [Bradyrhizobium sp. 521_C7_N1_3]|jgi:hypothetical protein|uniref:hypothetical protein n=1 Tax=Bradyrhizobium TaxID=374 RepID=UPI001BAE046B|nr:hypothetical protein [Bradyrhizobium japonicum]MBR0916576.1 hypothetical protein [Bradyrhizobium japonicum]MCS3495525.1 hypothetical protein [Bradyrhizobium japonicum]MCS3962313.1 hypothetical protein [Bradyrhizobium japonicum]MCS3994630.1 hypothetical protein [Bradyrhizobium japonicum]
MTADPTRGDNDRQETWHIYFSDVRIGTIGVRGGVPTTADEWGLGRRLLSRHGTEGTAIWFGRGTEVLFNSFSV